MRRRSFFLRLYYLNFFELGFLLVVSLRAYLSLSVAFGRLRTKHQKARFFASIRHYRNVRLDIFHMGEKRKWLLAFFGMHENVQWEKEFERRKGPNRTNRKGRYGNLSHRCQLTNTILFFRETNLVSGVPCSVDLAVAAIKDGTWNWIDLTRSTSMILWLLRSTKSSISFESLSANFRRFIFSTSLLS